MDTPATVISLDTQRLVGLIAQACVDLHTQPIDLRYGDMKRWLKGTLGLTQKDMREVEVYVASVGGFVTIRNAFFASAPSVKSVEQIELKGIAKLGRAATTVLANQELFLAKFEERMGQMLQKHAHYKPFGYAFKKHGQTPRGETGRVLNLALSDLHFGTSLDPREVPYRYGFKEEARRLASVVKRACEFKRDYRKETELVVWLGGDLIAGLIHDMVAPLALAEQVADAVWLLRQAIIVLAGEFCKVTVYCTSGNHDRSPLRHPSRATSNKWDSFASHIYVGVKAATLHLPNVSIYIPRTPHVEYSPFENQRIYATHGDNCLNAGNPGRVVNIVGIEGQMLRLNNGEVQKGHRPYNLFMVGHVHTASMTHLATGTLLTNGCLIPPDAYAISIGYTSTRNGQWMFESTPARIVGDSRFLDVDQSVDKDRSLDKLIMPWSGEF